MRYKDYCFWAKTPGAQLNVSIILSAVSFSGFFYVYYATLYWPLILSAVLMGSFLMLSVFYIVYSMIICYLMVKDYYFRK